MSLSAAVWPQFATQSFRLYSCSWKQFLTYLVMKRKSKKNVSTSIDADENFTLQNMKHMYGRLSVATGGLLFVSVRCIGCMEQYATVVSAAG